MAKRTNKDSEKKKDKLTPESQAIWDLANSGIIPDHLRDLLLDWAILQHHKQTGEIPNIRIQQDLLSKYLWNRHIFKKNYPKKISFHKGYTKAEMSDSDSGKKKKIVYIKDKTDVENVDNVFVGQLGIVAEFDPYKHDKHLLHLLTNK